jgi:hypothetical protein
MAVDSVPRVNGREYINTCSTATVLLDTHEPYHRGNHWWYAAPSSLAVPIPSEVACHDWGLFVVEFRFHRLSLVGEPWV